MWLSKESFERLERRLNVSLIFNGDRDCAPRLPDVCTDPRPVDVWLHPRVYLQLGMCSRRLGVLGRTKRLGPPEKRRKHDVNCISKLKRSQQNIGTDISFWSPNVYRNASNSSSSAVATRNSKSSLGILEHSLAGPLP